MGGKVCTGPWSEEKRDLGTVDFLVEVTMDETTLYVEILLTSEPERLLR